MSVLIVDNFDSFTYNLVHLVHRRQGKPVVVRNSAGPGQIPPGITHVILSPGPGSPTTPTDVGICTAVLDRAVRAKVPILGVCLGHQIVCTYFGGGIERLPAVRHGAVSRMRRTASGRLLSGLPHETDVMRYHSLHVAEATVPNELSVTAVAIDDGAVMTVEHDTLPVFGVQFHPESVATPQGAEIIRNFLAIRSGS
ncbi:anthranilate synthase component II [Micromonospora tarensis]|uniref:Aminodeoxychorismate/anthranilate synthase component II n=1 Tax=Micromonospora tarensis TaxID=2806100 RepID=A0ABS1YCC4_9ACTN|nr:aminodeoxychorismate/anthranilate synthase component II [Micromonospora tarensis]MBM0275010.1 aminodeoxychorismate/anthranilate synthase component II [Micromonospora tarensis]